MVKVTAPKHVREETAHALGVTGRTLMDYLQQGAPQGKDGTLDIEAIRRWCEANKRKGGKDLDEDGSEATKMRLQNRRLRALAEKTEIENAEQRGDLVRRDEIKSLFVARIYEVTQAMEGVESEAARRFSPEFGEWVAGQHRAIRERFGRPTPYDEPDEEPEKVSESGESRRELRQNKQESDTEKGAGSE